MNTSTEKLIDAMEHRMIVDDTCWDGKIPCLMVLWKTPHDLLRSFANEQAVRDITALHIKATDVFDKHLHIRATNAVAGMPTVKLAGLVEQLTQLKIRSEVHRCGASEIFELEKFLRIAPKF